MFPKVSATAGCPPAHSLLPGKAAAEELKTMVHFMGHFHARSGRYLNILKKVLQYEHFSFTHKLYLENLIQILFNLKKVMNH